MDLSAFTSANTPVFSFAGREMRARLLDVYDGDTVTVAAEVYPGTVRQLSIRLTGIDTPEMKGGDLEGGADPAEAARRRLAQLLAPAATAAGALEGVRTAAGRVKRADMRAALQARVNLVYVTCFGNDKYGRVLARVSSWAGGPHAGDVLLAEGLATPYFGGAKRPTDRQTNEA
jgi:endonuclease YncB( thermonuclease family)